MRYSIQLNKYNIQLKIHMKYIQLNKSKKKKYIYIKANKIKYTT